MYLTMNGPKPSCLNPFTSGVPDPTSTPASKNDWNKGFVRCWPWFDLIGPSWPLNLS